MKISKKTYNRLIKVTTVLSGIIVAGCLVLPALSAGGILVAPFAIGFGLGLLGCTGVSALLGLFLRNATVIEDEKAKPSSSVRVNRYSSLAIEDQKQKQPVYSKGIVKQNTSRFSFFSSCCGLFSKRKSRKEAAKQSRNSIELSPPPESCSKVTKLS